MKFLLIDDNGYCGKYLRSLITNNGDEYIEIENNDDLCSAYLKYKPDWLLIDIQMKERNGFNIIEKIKYKLPEAAIAVLSDFYDERLRLNAEKVGASVFIAKENLFDFYSIINSVSKK